MVRGVGLRGLAWLELERADESCDAERDLALLRGGEDGELDEVDWECVEEQRAGGWGGGWVEAWLARASCLCWYA